ncbi:hypothetical protein EDD16DRAFT_1517075 [Pisolithus croceorrhizus]|nr:hypothetical protein EDD16DRAFT_1517075 [Pisolithus croceorrhizus]
MKMINVSLTQDPWGWMMLIMMCNLHLYIQVQWTMMGKEAGTEHSAYTSKGDQDFPRKPNENTEGNVTWDCKNMNGEHERKTKAGNHNNMSETKECEESENRDGEAEGDDLKGNLPMGLL